jgi:hypothetical protein
LLLTTLGSAFAFAQSTRKPNVIVILSDDMGYTDIGRFNAPGGVKDIRTS